MPHRNLPIKKNNTNKIIVYGVVAAVGLVIALVALNSFIGASTPPQTASASRDWGSPNAPITIVEYSDFQ